MRIPLFFAVMVVFLAALAVYVHRRASMLLRAGRRGRRVLVGVLVAGFVALLAGRLARGIIPDAALRLPAQAGWLLALAVLLCAVLLAVVDLGRLLGWLGAHGFARLTGAPLPGVDALPAPEPAAPSPTSSSEVASPQAAPPRVASEDAGAPALPRRDFLARGAASGAFLVAGGSTLYGNLFGRHDYVLQEVPIRISGLPKSLDGFSLVQLSDIHLGLFVGEPELRAAVELVRRARGDLIVLTGDLIDSDPAYVDTLGRFVRTLTPLAREGVAAIPGNHDYFAGIGVTLAALADAGATVLQNRGRVVGGPGGAFALLGVDDVAALRLKVPGGGPDLTRALADVPRDLPRVLLCHNPVFFPDAADRVALQMSGHTHGGQFNLGLRPADWVLPYGYVEGHYTRGDAQLYINRGFGTAGPPARLGAPPEVTRIVLVSA